MNMERIHRNEIERTLSKSLHEPNQWRAVRRMKYAAKTMLLKYRDYVVAMIEASDEGIYTFEELFASMKSGEAYNYWVREYLPSDELIHDKIYGEEE